MTRTRLQRKPRRASDRGIALKHWEMHFGPNMTPMVDVVMVILIFFMAGTALIAPEMFLSAGLPSESSDPDAPGPVIKDPFELPPARFTLHLSRTSETTVIDGLGLSAGGIDELPARLATLSGDQSQMAILIQPDANVPFADVIAVHDRCASSGLTRIGLLESPTTP